MEGGRNGEGTRKWGKEGKRESVVPVARIDGFNILYGSWYCLDCHVRIMNQWDIHTVG